MVTADGMNNELERPHVVVHDGRYYLWFSTQSRTFHPDVPAPTGLYGFVADSLLGPYEPLNGHAGVLVNPPSRPRQAYSWLVLNDLSVVGFVDAYGFDAVADELVLTDADSDRASGRVRRHVLAHGAAPARRRPDSSRRSLTTPIRAPSEVA